jgi:hypothetical protein
MKTGRIVIVVLILVSGWTAAHSQQDRIEVPGDHFSLEGALELFKKSSSPEEFERLLNSPDSEVNNLDLNGDGVIDYIKVIDRNEGNVHAFILQAIISATERQDVAVIELEKSANGKAVLQITGDADIYGIETIIEPTEEVRINAGTSTMRNVVNVWTWPSVQYIYSPYYYGWISPWDWGYYPYWWSSWRPVTYYYYYSRWERYRPYYSVCHTHRIVYAQRIYRPYRSTSVVVYDRHRTQITDYRSSRQYSSDFNRGRNNGDRYGRNTYDRGNNGRQQSITNDRTNSRSSIDNQSWRQRNNNTSNGSATIRDHSSSVNRNTEERRNDSDWKRSNSDNSTWRQHQNNRQQSENTSDGSPTIRERSSVNIDRERNNSDWNRDNTANSSWHRLQENRQQNSNHSTVSRERNQSSFENRSSNDQRQPAERSANYGNRDNSTGQRESRPAFDTRSTQQRSVVQPDRGRSSGNSDMQRSGSGNGGSKSPVQKRGRD